MRSSAHAVTPSVEMVRSGICSPVSSVSGSNRTHIAAGVSEVSRTSLAVPEKAGMEEKSPDP